MKINYNNVSLRISAGFPGQFPHDRMPQIAFSGRSNVGKSSLVNCLLNRKSLARVSGQPGKTITVNFYDIDKKLFFVDLPGYGFAKRSAEDQRRWSGLVETYLTKSEELRLVIQLIDMRHGPTEDDNLMLSFLNETQIPYIVVATKSDKLNKTEFNAMSGALSTHPLIAEGTPIIPFSAIKPVAAEDIRKAILAAIDN